MNWLKQFRFNPIIPLINSEDPAVTYFTKALIGEKTISQSKIWEFPEVKKILKRQTEDGSFKHYKKKQIYPKYHHKLVETWKKFRILIKRFNLTKDHPQIEKAAEFIFSCQKEEGDIRGMIGNQYATYYTGAMLGLLINAGYVHDNRIDKGFEWLLTMRHNDGGWTVPMQTHNLDRKTTNRITSEFDRPLKPKINKPSSRLATDMVLRAFAADPLNRYLNVAQRAGKLLKSWFFKPDHYNSYKSADYWVRFKFWWPNLMTALNSLSILGFSHKDPDIKKGLDWFIDNQKPTGLWNLSYMEGKKGLKENKKDKRRRLWLTLDICKIFKTFFNKDRK